MQYVISYLDLKKELKIFEGNQKGNHFFKAGFDTTPNEKAFKH